MFQAERRYISEMGVRKFRHLADPPWIAVSYNEWLPETIDFERDFRKI